MLKGVLLSPILNSAHIKFLENNNDNDDGDDDGNGNVTDNIKINKNKYKLGINFQFVFNLGYLNNKLIFIQYKTIMVT